MVAYGRLKTKEHFKLLALKVVAVAYERWSLTRGFQCRDLAEKLLVFWKTGRLQEVVATGGSTVFRSSSYSTCTLHEMSNCPQLIMHQSIPAVHIPPTPPGNRGAFAHVVSPGGGAFAILSRPRELGISVPRGDPQHLTLVFSKER